MHDLNKIKVNYKYPLAYYNLSVFLKNYINESTIIMCIGTDRCIGDCLGPLVGTYLKKYNFPLPVYGTVSNPIHALNIDEKLNKVKNSHKNSNIIGVDACLGDINEIGDIQGRNYPIHPGKGVGKNLPNVGEASIIGIVDSSSSDELFTNRSIRLNLIMNMSEVIAHALLHSYYLFKKEN